MTDVGSVYWLCVWCTAYASTSQSPRSSVLLLNFLLLLVTNLLYHTTSPFAYLSERLCPWRFLFSIRHWFSRFVVACSPSTCGCSIPLICSSRTIVCPSVAHDLAQGSMHWYWNFHERLTVTGVMGRGGGARKGQTKDEKEMSIVWISGSSVVNFSRAQNESGTILHNGTLSYFSVCRDISHFCLIVCLVCVLP